MTYLIKLGCVSICLAALLAAQQPPAPPADPPKTQSQPNPADFQPVRMGNDPAPAPAKPAAEQAAQPAPVQTTTQPAQTAEPAPSVGGLNLRNASLTEVIDQLARLLKLNYILDPRVKGGVYLNTYGEMKSLDARNLLDLILRINGAAMVQVGDLHRIVPLTDLSRMPLAPETKSASKDIPEDDRPMLNLVFLKYATVDELAKVLAEFTGEGARMITYPPANLLFILDSHRSMRRTMELIAMFDSDLLTNQRVRLFEVKNGRPSDIAGELTTIMKNVSLSGATEKTAPVRFLPVDRINTIIAVAPNPGAFDTVEVWLKKLDIPVTSSGGAQDSFVYRVKYQRAECLAMALMQLYGSYFGGYGMGGMGMGMGMGGYGMGGMGMGGYGMGGIGMGGMGMGGAGGGTVGGANSGLGVGAGCGGLTGMMGMGGMGMGMGGYGGYGGMQGYGMAGGYGGQGYGGYGMPGGYAPQYPMAASPFGPTTAAPGGIAGAGPAGAAQAGGDLTGSYLGAARGGYGSTEPPPRIVPNPMDNSLLIQASQSQYQSISKLMRQLDVPPRQILLEAKIYEVTLTGAFASGVSAAVQRLAANGQTAMPSGTRQITGSLKDGAVQLSAGALIGASRELLAFLSLSENESRTRVVSAPSLIATDSIPASITVGNEVPTLTAQGASAVQVGGTSTFTQQIQSRQTGVTLNVMAHVNPSGIVTLIINQEVSAPGPSTSGINSPSFSNRSVQTQITMQDGDTIAIGGIINEDSTYTTTGIPLLHRIPILGAAFGSRSYSKGRSELIIFMTPRVIYDNTDLLEASDELKGRLKRLRRIVQE